MLEDTYGYEEINHSEYQVFPAAQAKNNSPTHITHNQKTWTNCNISLAKTYARTWKKPDNE